MNMLKICTTLEPMTTTMKKAMSPLLTGKSSSRSAAFPIGTFPRLVMFLSNLALLLRRLRGGGCDNREEWSRRG